MKTNTEGPSLHYLLGRLGVVEDRVRAAVAARRLADPEADDAFRGLYLSDAHVDRLLAHEPFAAIGDTGEKRLAQVESEGDAAETAGVDLRLRRLVRTFSLDALETEVLLIALAVDLDSRFERFYGYLNDDVTRRRPTVGLALELCGVLAVSAEARARLGEHGRLAGNALIDVEECERPFLARVLRVPDRVTGHLLGDDRVDGLLVPLLARAPLVPSVDTAGLGSAIRSGVRLIYVRESRGASARALAHAALTAAGHRVLSLDMEGVTPDNVVAALRSAVREAMLTESALVLGPVEAVAGDGGRTMRRLVGVSCPIILCGTTRWDSAWSRGVPLTVEAASISEAERSACWNETLDGHLDEGVDAMRITSQFRLSPEQISKAAEGALLHAQVAGISVGAAHLAEACREQNAAGLERLARRIEPSAGWGDIVLPPEPFRQLHEIAARARWRRRVLDEWGMGGTGDRKRGISALFCGASGTGKTLAAEVIARELGLDLYRVDLASVVDKYIGETEKNLRRIFDEAEGVSGVLLFDEADALFGRRSEVRDSHDRYANIEVAYLLQRMESFDGVAILATNLRANLDDAFTRRLDVIVTFPVPDEGARRRIWEQCIPSEVPCDDDIDFGILAKSFDISGGDIRNACLAAVYAAAGEECPLCMDDMLKATEREYRKLGRLGFEQGSSTR